MMRSIVGLLLAASLVGAVTLIGAAGASGTSETRHGRIEELICARPRHFFRMHGIEIMPESCDR